MQNAKNGSQLLNPPEKRIEQLQKISSTKLCSRGADYNINQLNK